MKNKEYCTTHAMMYYDHGRLTGDVDVAIPDGDGWELVTSAIDSSADFGVIVWTWVKNVE